MASKVVPYFILTADGVAMPSPSVDDESDFVNSSIESFNVEKKQKPKVAKKTKKQKQKIIAVSTREEATKNRMEYIKQKLDESRERFNQKQSNLTKAVPRLHDTKPHLNGSQDGGSDKSSETGSQRPVELVSLSNSPHKSNAKLPYVYFVVSIDKTSPVLKPPKDLEIVNAIPPGSPFAVKRRERFLASRDEMRIRKEERKMYNSNVNDPCLKTKPIRNVLQKQLAFHSSTMTPPKNPPGTPATTLTTSALFLDMPDDSMTLPEEAEVDISDFLDSRPSTKHCSMRFLELPYISVDEQRKALGTAPASINCKPMEFTRRTVSQCSSTNRKVRFSDGLPSITGNTIIFSDMDSVRSLGPRSATTIPSLLSKEQHDEKLQSKERRKFTKSKTPTKHSFKKQQNESLNLPKIDIVSNVYNDLIVKAINTYIQQFPVNSQQSKLALQLLGQLQNQSISVSELGSELGGSYSSRPGKRMVIKEIDPVLNDLIQGSDDTGGKMAGNRVKPKPLRERQYSSISPKSFKMAQPGLKKENTVIS